MKKVHTQLRFYRWHHIYIALWYRRGGGWQLMRMAMTRNVLWHNFHVSQFSGSLDFIKSPIETKLGSLVALIKIKIMVCNTV